MKKLTLLAVFVCGFLIQAIAQERVEERLFEVNPDEQVRLDLRFGETIDISAWDRDEVAFKAVIEINGGRLNDALELEYDQDEGLKIASDYNEGKLKEGRRDDCPDQYSRYSWSNDDDYHVVCSKIRYELKVPRNINLDVESISGDIELVGLTGPVRSKSISGYVDLSWPAGNSADISVKTISGEAFTNLDNLNFKNKKSHVPLVGYKLRGSIGMGGPEVSLESVSGNIYLRKAKT
jgi:hypothetical protein